MLNKMLHQCFMFENIASQKHLYKYTVFTYLYNESKDLYVLPKLATYQR